MRTVAEYRKFAMECRELAAKLKDTRDKRALELMAAGWEKVALEREVALQANVLQRPMDTSSRESP
jgi:hypothetical protein